jgi:hypothetical protein
MTTIFVLLMVVIVAMGWAPDRRVDFVDWTQLALMFVAPLILCGFFVVANFAFTQVPVGENTGLHLLAGVIAMSTGVLTVILIMIARMLANAMIVSGL